MGEGKLIDGIWWVDAFHAPPPAHLFSIAMKPWRNTPPIPFTTTLRERLVSYSVSQSPAFLAFTASDLDNQSGLLAWGDF